MAEEPEKAEGEKGGKSKLPLILIILVVVLAAGGGGAFFMLKGKSAPKKEEAEAHAPPPKVSVAVGFDAFTVNLADPRGDRYLKIALSVVVNDAKVAEAFKSDALTKTRVRDRVLTVLTSKMYQDINTGAGKELLRKDLAREINSVLPHDAVEEVLFSEFTVQ